ncbi:DUF6428 family protein [Pedobacter cryoconitis]|uniref:Uncharacterized protein n=1 Tax=Pedobacter cryoconitis TaxID=188932 RepID=A0A7X0MKR1_9SPHI|nr:DUF6428 family protein [Pedobacter cryoconitis]MBB6500718.1 hypothetical protein [Pedobacter cryoconitis]
MNKPELINWKTFKSFLEQHPEQLLQFQYGDDKRIDASYHLTEIKQAPITSVDCGGVMNTWTEVILQLWEPEKKDSTRAMQVKKALSIINLVEQSMPLNPLAVVKIEFGNEQYDMRQLFPTQLNLTGDDLIVDLNPGKSECKAIGRGESCGTVPKLKIEMFNLTDGNTCSPDSGCC